MLNKDGHYAKPCVFKDLASPRFGVSAGCAGCEMTGEVGSLINNSNKRESYRVNKPSATKAMPFGGGHGKAVFRPSGSPKDCACLHPLLCPFNALAVSMCISLARSCLSSIF